MEKKYWEDKEYAYFSHKKCRYFPCHKELIQRTLTVCSAIARFMPLETNAAEISNIMRRDLKIVQWIKCQLPHKKKNYGCDRKISGTCCDDAESKKADHKNENE